MYSNQELNELKSVFQTLDKDGDGKLTYNELKNAFITYFGKSISEIKLQEIMEDSDGNADGVISYEEFLRAGVTKEKLLEERNLSDSCHILGGRGLRPIICGIKITGK